MSTSSVSNHSAGPSGRSEDPPAGPEHPTDARSERRRRLGWTAAGVFVLASIGMWLWILFIYNPGLLIDELPDSTFPMAAEKICAQADDEIDHLPPAQATEDPNERAGVIDTANQTLTKMVAELAPLAPTQPPDSAEAVNEWLGDWTTHLGDRQRYADELRKDPEARFTETTKGSKQVSRAIDSFAEVNSMPHCGTPGDV